MATTNFTLRVPKNTTTPISRVVITLSLTNENAATFTITDPVGNAHTFAALAPPTPPAGAATDPFNYPAPAGIPRQDRVVIERPAAAIGDPRRKTCIITFNLNTDFDPGAGCVCSMVNPFEEWQVTVAAGTQISGVCQLSFTRTSATGCLGVNANVLIMSNNPADLATISGQANQKCGLERSGVDIVQVLDRSGSMGSQSQLAGLPMTRMQALQQAVKNFVGVWGDLIATGDRLGIVTFDDLIETPPWIGVGLQAFNNTLEGTVTSNISSVTDRGATSIGGGLIQGANALTGGGGANRRVILLMSDGQQNTDPHVGANPPAAPNLPPTYDVFTYNAATPAVKTTLPGLSAASPYQIYTVTVGPSAVVAAAINDNIAKATGGFYINSEDNGNLLNPFFVELLGNFVRFNSWETARLIHGQVTRQQPCVTKFPFSTTTQRVAINLSWPEGLGALRLRVHPPGISSPPTAFEEVSESGSLTLSFEPTGLLDPIEDWTITVELFEPIILSFAGAVEGAVEFDMVVLVDDLAVKSELSIVPADYLPGNKIQLQARLRAFSEPVESLGSNPGDQVVVQAVRPGQSIGDLLSSSKASTTPPQNGDKTSLVEAKLFNTLQEDPNALGRNNDNPDIVILQEASPGLYTGSYEAKVVGHYNFLFGLEGLTDGAGRFSRQEIKTVYVRAIPDSTETAFQTRIERLTGGNQLLITMTPRTKRSDPTQTGNMGPGWAPYFWFTTPGQAPSKAEDNSDGTYTAKFLFSGVFPPTVTLHFLDVLMVIDDSVTPDRLPVPLDNSTVLVPFVGPLPFPFTLPLPWLVVLLILLAFLIGFILGVLL